MAWFAGTGLVTTVCEGSCDDALRCGHVIVVERLNPLLLRPTSGSATPKPPQWG